MATGNSRKRSARAATVRKANWRRDVKRLRKDFTTAASHGERALKAVGHNAAVAAFQWVASHEGRVAAFRKAIRGTHAEKPVNAALRAVRKEAESPVGSRRRRRRVARKTPRAAPARRRARTPVERFMMPPMF